MKKKSLLFVLFICIKLNTMFSIGLHVGASQTYANVPAAWQVAQPGDTIYVHAGTYNDGYQYNNGLSGANNKWIVITRYKNDNVVIDCAWQMSSIKYVKFQYLKFEKSTGFGRFVSIDNNGSCNTRSKHVVFDSCYFLNSTLNANATVFKLSGVDSFQVKNCVFKNNPVADAMDYNICHEGLISGNYIENCLSGHVKGGAANIIIERNIFKNMGAGWPAFEIGGDTGVSLYCPEDAGYEVKNLKFHSNIIIGGSRGLMISSAVECEVTNNTIYNPSQAMLRVLCVSATRPDNRDNKVENNIFAFGSFEYINVGTTLTGNPQPANAVTFNKNIYYSTVNSSFAGPYWDPAGNNIKEVSPLLYGSGTAMFVNASTNDFHLAPTSPAIGAGINKVKPSVDFYGYLYKNPRSIGASEYNSVPANIAEMKINGGDFVCYPNPSNNDKVTILGFNAQQSAEVKSVELISINGQIISSTQVTQLPADISTIGVPKGIYVLRITGENFISNQKVIFE